ncbi:protein S100-A6-like [Parambassis ranga]|uniref:Protein S100 n=1 Tax=Parambassis ranga TaxID=210632 RepID=A0A6P7JXS9_9TELE|nr:protein S100-A6-like [Parambassis ranga]
MSGIKQAIILLRTTFDKYAGKEGDKHTLTKKELTELLRNELSTAEVETFFQMLDEDQDGVVNFQEYATFVATLSVYLKI